MREPISVTSSLIEFEGASIRLFEGQGLDSATDDSLWMFKTPWYVDTYREIGRHVSSTSRSPMNILEVGIFKGGSTAFLNEFYRPKRIACIDLYDLRTSAF